MSPGRTAGRGSLGGYVRILSGSLMASDELPASCGSGSASTPAGSVVAGDLAEYRFIFFERVMLCNNWEISGGWGGRCL